MKCSWNDGYQCQEGGMYGIAGYQSQQFYCKKHFDIYYYYSKDNFESLSQVKKNIKACINKIAENSNAVLSQIRKTSLETISQLRILNKNVKSVNELRLIYYDPKTISYLVK